jgi:hypothetical protein
MKLIATMALCAALAPAAEWKQLFNGKDLNGWSIVGPGSFTVENGMLKTHGGMGLLWYTQKQFGNAILRVVFKTTGPTDNSGVYIRFPEPPKVIDRVIYFRITCKFAVLTGQPAGRCSRRYVPPASDSEKPLGS